MKTWGIRTQIKKTKIVLLINRGRLKHKIGDINMGACGGKFAKDPNNIIIMIDKNGEKLAWQLNFDVDSAEWYIKNNLLHAKPKDKWLEIRPDLINKVSRI